LAAPPEALTCFASEALQGSRSHQAIPFAAFRLASLLKYAIAAPGCWA
jgi:hypothetical protein